MHSVLSSSLPRRPLERIAAGRAAAEVTRLVLATLHSSRSALITALARSYFRPPISLQFWSHLVRSSFQVTLGMCIRGAVRGKKSIFRKIS
jgi:hypothetical protein